MIAHGTLGRSGLVVSRLGLGGNNFGRACDQEATDAVVRAALGAGIDFFDTADCYGLGASERMLGQALRGHRDDVVVATKFGLDMQGANGPDLGARGSRRYVRRAVEASLERLGTDYIDLYQYHAPDGVTPIEETLATLDDLVREGKVRYIGFSNAAPWEVVDAWWAARSSGGTPFVSVQAHYSLLHRQPETELTQAAARAGVGIIPWYPLANGVLTGKYRRGEEAPPGSRLADRLASVPASAFDLVDRLRSFAEERQLGLLDVALGGLVAQPGVASVIAGATSAEQVVANVAASQWTPGPDDLAELDAIVPRGTVAI